MVNQKKSMNKKALNPDTIKNYFEWSHSTAPFRISKIPEINIIQEENISETTLVEDKKETANILPANLDELCLSIKDCLACPLGKTRHNLVFGEGNPEADLMFIGEGPGYDEDMSGRPFVGKAGQLLTQIIENGLKIKRNSVYIANIVKCRPPNNRDPLESEASICISYLLEQIKFIKPKVIVLLGKVATKFLLNRTESISYLRNNEYVFENSKVFITYHPSALLRNEALKRPVWEDMKKVMKELNL